MSMNVFANGNGISAKKDDNKSIAAPPDVCLSPPSPPAGPVPIPYPNTAQASDTSNGSKTVQIGGAEVGMKNLSNYKKSTGDEAATKTLGMGVVSHNITGPMRHAAWSMDVKIEGANAIRHMDMTTHNHINADNVTLTINQELEMRAQFEELDCDQLEDGMDEMQTQEMIQPVDSNQQPSYALANAQYNPAEGPGSYMKSASTVASVRPECRDGYQPSRDPQEERPLCTDIRTRAGNRTQDAESKILTPLSEPTFAPDGAFGTQGGNILMNITHSNADCSSGQDRMPCIHCRRAICAAEDCGIQVWICVGQEEPVRPAAQGLCPPPEGPEAEGLTAWDPGWAAAGMGCR